MTRREIDAWSLPDSGLAARAVNCLTLAGVQTVGELRPWTDAKLKELQAFGKRSLKNVRWFFAWTDRLEAGTAVMPDLRTLLREFLTSRQLDVIERRFGLTDPLFRPWMKRTTLREIGLDRGGVCREGIRQMEELALNRLRTHLARELTARLPAPVAEAKRGDAVLGGYETWGAQALLSALSR